MPPSCWWCGNTAKWARSSAGFSVGDSKRPRHRAELDGKLVGTVHVRYLGHWEGWLEGVRVRTEYRQQGVASALIEASHEYAKKKRCRVMQLETGLMNLAAQRTFEKFAYRQIVRY